MPTYDNFKKDFKVSPHTKRQSIKDSNPLNEMGKYGDFSANKTEKTKEQMAASASESQ